MGVISVIMFLLGLSGVIFTIIVNYIGGINISIGANLLLLQLLVIALLIVVGILATSIKELEEKSKK